jgi:3-hydroxyisobutyrate dehydrogenase-like beta-hydroxyacid dehydrogenase
MGAKQKIGWIGVGKMGNPMSKNLIKAGYSLTVFDIVPEAMNALAEAGAKVASSAAEAAADAEVIVSMIPDDHALEDVSMGPKGVFKGIGSNVTYIDMSTVSPIISARVSEVAEEKGIKYLRAPVSGSTEAAEKASLTIMASGPKDAYDQCEDIFKLLGQKIFHVGEGDEARYMKLLVNMMVGITSAMTAEALIFGEKGGLDWSQMIDTINNSVIASPLIGFKVQLLKDRDYSPMFTATQMAKDFDLALDTGKAMDIPMPITALTRQLYGSMKATDKGGFDYFGIVALFEEMAGLKP